MKTWGHNWFIAISVLLLSTFGTATARAYSDLVVLGDSLSDVGNLHVYTGGVLPQNSSYYSGRFSDGPSYAEHLYQHLGLPGVLAPSAIGGTDYAVGGARTRYHAADNPVTGFDPSVFNPLVDASSFDRGSPLPYSLRAQADALLVNNGQTLDADALYTVWIGSNDVADAFRSVLLSGGNTTYAMNLLAQSVQDLTGVIADLVDAGASHLLIPTVPNLGLVPDVQGLLPFVPNADAIASGLAQAFNAAVDQQLSAFTAKITRLDTFSLLTDLVDDPTSFGLPSTMNVTDACFDGYVGIPGNLCDDPGGYVFFDKIHPSAATHVLLGELAAQAVPAPLSLALILLGLAGMGYQRRRLASA